MKEEDFIMSRKRMGDDIFASGAFFAPYAWKLATRMNQKRMEKIESFRKLPKNQQLSIKCMRWTKYQKYAKYALIACVPLELFAIVTGHFSFNDFRTILYIAVIFGITVVRKNYLQKQLEK